MFFNDQRSQQKDRGSVESALVLLPTLILFLSVLQIGVSVLGKAMLENTNQGKVSRLALVNSNEDPVGIQIERTPLPGGGELISGIKHSKLPALSPLLIGHNQLTQIGISFDENQ